jgi:beta-fructofuranosidase
VQRFAEQWTAHSNPDLITWEKHPQNPILSEAQHHPDANLRNWRDPYIWKEGETWYMVISGQEKGENFGSVYLYGSNDLETWQNLGRLYQGEPSQGKTWECPNYFRIGEYYVLVVSPFGQVIYSIGSFRNQQHHTAAWHVLDHGIDFYATNTFWEKNKRVVLVGWVKAKGKGPWAGCLSLPREVRLNQHKQLQLTPIPELEILRYKHRHIERSLERGADLAGTAPYFGECVEIKAKFELVSAKAVGFDLSDDQESHEIRLDLETKILKAVDEQAALQFLEDPSHLDLHIFIDRCVIEIFINGRETFTTLFYPKLDEHHALKISPFFVKAQGTVMIDFWTLRGIQPEGGK